MSELLVILCLLAFPFYLQSIVFRCLPKRFTAKPRVRAITILLAMIELIIIVQICTPRFRPHGPAFATADYVLMALVPIAAFISGLFEASISHTFTFGAICGTIFISLYHDDRFSLAWQIDHGETSIAYLIEEWAAVTLLAGLGCCALARLASLSKPEPFPLYPPLCRTCRYDLRAHPPGTRCAECGTVVQ